MYLGRLHGRVSANQQAIARPEIEWRLISAKPADLDHVAAGRRRRLLVLRLEGARAHGPAHCLEHLPRLSRRVQQFAHLADVNATTWTGCDRLLAFGDRRQVQVLSTAFADEMAGSRAPMRCSNSVAHFRH